jgi:hypothetical protein
MKVVTLHSQHHYKMLKGNLCYRRGVKTYYHYGQNGGWVDNQDRSKGSLKCVYGKKIGNEVWENFNFGPLIVVVLKKSSW